MLVFRGFFYIINGIPNKEGTNFELGVVLEPPEFQSRLE